MKQYRVVIGQTRYEYRLFWAYTKKEARCLAVEDWAGKEEYCGSNEWVDTQNPDDMKIISVEEEECPIY